MEQKVAILTLTFLFGAVCCHACTCRMQHPQQDYCNSDFVILARIKRFHENNDTRLYKVRVRKQYKINEKGLLALKDGRLITAKYQSMCRLDLELGKLYVISGNIFSLKAYVNMCQMALPWESLSRRQRKGLKMLYKHGCTCQIRDCHGRSCYRNRETCNWHNNCETREGICQRQASGSCMWTRNRALTKCTREWKRNVTLSMNHKKKYPIYHSFPLP